VGSLNVPPLNLQNPLQQSNNNVKLAVNTANRPVLKEKRTGHTRIEVVTLDTEEATPHSAHARGTPVEVVTLEVEEVLVDLNDEGYLCVSC
jgi:hypothetical protein